MTFTDHQVRQLLGKLDRIAIALDRLADNHGSPAPTPEPKPAVPPALPRSVRLPKPDRPFQF